MYEKAAFHPYALEFLAHELVASCLPAESLKGTVLMVTSYIDFLKAKQPWEK